MNPIPESRRASTQRAIRQRAALLVVSSPHLSLGSPMTVLLTFDKMVTSHIYQPMTVLTYKIVIPSIK